MISTQNFMILIAAYYALSGTVAVIAGATRAKKSELYGIHEVLAGLMVIGVAFLIVIL